MKQESQDDALTKLEKIKTDCVKVNSKNIGPTLF